MSNTGNWQLFCSEKIFIEKYTGVGVGGWGVGGAHRGGGGGHAVGPHLPNEVKVKLFNSIPFQAKFTFVLNFLKSSVSGPATAGCSVGWLEASWLSSGNRLCW